MKVWHYMDDEGERYFTTEKQAVKSHADDQGALSKPTEYNFKNRKQLVQYLNIMLGGD